LLLLQLGSIPLDPRLAFLAASQGIDHATVRYVLHATMSKSLEGYYQEAGRAGRDGLPAECVLFYGKRDGPRLLNLMRRPRKGAKRGSFQREMAQLNAMTEFCATHASCRHAQLLSYFGEAWARQRCTDRCDVCRGEVEVVPTVEATRARKRSADSGKVPSTSGAVLQGQRQLAGDGTLAAGGWKSKTMQSKAAAAGRSQPAASRSAVPAFMSAAAALQQHKGQTSKPAAGKKAGAGTQGNTLLTSMRRAAGPKNP